MHNLTHDKHMQEIIQSCIIVRTKLMCRPMYSLGFVPNQYNDCMLHNKYSYSVNWLAIKLLYVHTELKDSRASNFMTL